MSPSLAGQGAGDMSRTLRMTNFPANWAATANLPNLPTRIMELLSKFGPLEGLPVISKTSDGVPVVIATFADHLAAKRVVRVLHNVDNRSETTKRQANGASAEASERFRVQLVSLDAALALRRVRVHGVPHTCSQHSFRQVCQQYGEVEKVSFDCKGRFIVSFVSCQDARVCQRALQEQRIEGAQLGCELAADEEDMPTLVPGDIDLELTDSPAPSLVVYVDELIPSDGDPELTDREIFLRDLPLEEFTEPQLREWLETFGNIDRIVFLENRVTKQLTGMGYVRFVRHEDAVSLVAAFPPDDEAGNVQGQWSLSERLLRIDVAGDTCAALSVRLEDERTRIEGCSQLVLAGDGQSSASALRHAGAPANLTDGPLHFMAWLRAGFAEQTLPALRTRFAAILAHALRKGINFLGQARPPSPLSSQNAETAPPSPLSKASECETPRDGEDTEPNLREESCLLVRGFPPSWNEHQIKLVFAIYGGVQSIRFVYIPERAAHVEMKDAACVEKAVEDLDGKCVGDNEVVEACEITCTLLAGAAGGQSLAMSRTASSSRTLFVDELPMPRRPDVQPSSEDVEVFMTSIPSEDRDEQLIRSWLSGFGTIDDVSLLRDTRTGELTGKGYVRFATHVEAEACIEAHALAAREGEVAMCWSESERAAQRLRSAYGLDVHSAFLGEDSAVLSTITASSQLKELFVLGETCPCTQAGAPQSQGKQLHFSAVCDDHQFMKLKNTLAASLATFHNRASKRLKVSNAAKPFAAAKAEPTLEAVAARTIPQRERLPEAAPAISIPRQDVSLELLLEKPTPRHESLDTVLSEPKVQHVWNKEARGAPMLSGSISRCNVSLEAVPEEHKSRQDVSLESVLEEPIPRHESLDTVPWEPIPQRVSHKEARGAPMPWGSVSRRKLSHDGVLEEHMPRQRHESSDAAHRSMMPWQERPSVAAPWRSIPQHEVSPEAVPEEPRPRQSFTATRDSISQHEVSLEAAPEETMPPQESLDGARGATTQGHDRPSDAALGASIPQHALSLKAVPAEPMPRQQSLDVSRRAPMTHKRPSDTAPRNPMPHHEMSLKAAPDDAMPRHEPRHERPCDTAPRGSMPQREMSLEAVPEEQVPQHEPPDATPRGSMPQHEMSLEAVPEEPMPRQKSPDAARARVALPRHRERPSDAAPRASMPEHDEVLPEAAPKALPTRHEQASEGARAESSTLPMPWHEPPRNESWQRQPAQPSFAPNLSHGFRPPPPTGWCPPPGAGPYLRGHALPLPMRPMRPVQSVTAQPLSGGGCLAQPGPAPHVQSVPRRPIMNGDGCPVWPPPRPPPAALARREPAAAPTLDPMLQARMDLGQQRVFAARESAMKGRTKKAADQYRRGLRYMLEVTPRLEEEERNPRAQELLAKISGYMEEAERHKKQLDAESGMSDDAEAERHTQQLDAEGGMSDDAEPERHSQELDAEIGRFIEAEAERHAMQLDAEGGMSDDALGGDVETPGDRPEDATAGQELFAAAASPPPDLLECQRRRRNEDNAADKDESLDALANDAEVLLRDGEAFEADGKVAWAYEGYCRGLQQLAKVITRLEEGTPKHTVLTRKLKWYLEHAENMKPRDEIQRDPSPSPLGRSRSRRRHEPRGRSREEFRRGRRDVSPRKPNLQNGRTFLGTSAKAAPRRVTGRGR